jgi:hypothetical protein
MEDKDHSLKVLIISTEKQMLSTSRASRVMLAEGETEKVECGEKKL